MKKLYLFLTFALLPFLALSQWSNDHATNIQVTNHEGEQVIPKVDYCPNGDFYVGYFSGENGNYNVRLQLYDFQGNQLWEDNGILISNHPSMSWLTDWDMKADKEGNAILAFQDIRDGSEINNVYAYKISSSGEFLWGDDGILVSLQGQMNASPKVCVTAVNNVIIAYMSDNSVFFQKYAPDGQALWTKKFEETSTTNYTWPQLMAVGEDDFIMKYFEDSGPFYSPDRYVYVQRYDTNGEGVWAQPAPVSTAGSISAWTQIFSMKNDGNDGVFISWHDGRTSDWNSYSYLQYVDANGQVMFTQNGVLLSTLYNDNQFYSQLVVPENHEFVYVFWYETDSNQTQYGIFGQKVSYSGEILWGDIGIPFFNIGSLYYNVVDVKNVGNDAVLFYEKENGTNATSINAMRIDPDGNTVWQEESVAISSTPNEKIHIVVSEPFENQWILAWEEDRSDNSDVFAQNLTFEGNIGLSGTVEGTISFQNGEADMSLTTISDGTNTYTPDENGNYSIGVPIGEQTITFSNPYTTAVEETVMVEGGQTETLDIILDVIKTDITVFAVDQYGTPLNEYGLIVVFDLQSPEGTYSGIIEGESFSIQCAPYGSYTGTAYYENSEPVSVGAEIDNSSNTINFVFLLTSLQEIGTQNNLLIYPNPISNNATLRIWLSEIQSGSFVLTDIKGNLISRTDKIDFRLGETTFLLNELFNTKSLSTGVYQIEFRGEKQHYLIKTIVK